MAAVDPHRDLIGTHDPGMGVLQRDGERLGPCQPRRQRQRPLAAAARLIDPGAMQENGTREPFQQLPPVGRGRGQNK